MATGMLHLHHTCVVLFVLIYLIKTILLLSDRDELLTKFKQKTKLLEIIVSVGFLGTGIFLMTQLPVITSITIIKLALVFLSIPLAIIGFKNKNKILAALSFFLIITSYVLGHKAKDAKAGDKIVAVNGKEIFEEKCTLCHGSDGKLGMNGAKDITTTQLSHADIVSLINNGKNSMPAFHASLSKEQIDAVTNYVESDLKRK